MLSVMQLLGRRFVGRVAVRESKGVCASSRIGFRSGNFSGFGNLQAARGASGWISKIGRVALFLWLACLPAVQGALLPPPPSVTLAWNASPDPNIIEYQVYVGTASQSYSTVISAGNSTAVNITDLTQGATYYFAVTAINMLGIESSYSNEIIYTVPGGNRPTIKLLLSPTKQVVLRVTGQLGHIYEIQASSDLKSWDQVGVVVLNLGISLDFTDTSAAGKPARFYRLREIL